MRQYDDVKRMHADKLVLFQFGDFYEAFDADADKLAELLGVRLTSKYGRVMTGIPVTTFARHANTLVNEGLSVVQVVALPEKDKRYDSKVQVRRVERILSPGTRVMDEELDVNEAASRTHNYLLGVFPMSLGRGDAAADLTTVGLAWTDVSTGESAVCASPLASLEVHLLRVGPKEIIVPRRNAYSPVLLRVLEKTKAVVTPVDESFFDKPWGSAPGEEPPPTELFERISEAERKALRGVCAYADTMLLARAPSLSLRRTRLDGRDVMAMDANTISALELLPENRTGAAPIHRSFLSVIDKTRTPPGARLLRSRLMSPLRDPGAIRDRLDAVAFFVERGRLRASVRDTLRAVRDGERPLQRVVLDRASEADFRRLAMVLEKAWVAHDDVAAGLDATTATTTTTPLPAVVRSMVERMDPSFALRAPPVPAGSLEPLARLLAASGAKQDVVQEELDRFRKLCPGSLRELAELLSSAAGSFDVGGVSSTSSSSSSSSSSGVDAVAGGGAGSSTGEEEVAAAAATTSPTSAPSPNTLKRAIQRGFSSVLDTLADEAECGTGDSAARVLQRLRDALDEKAGGDKALATEASSAGGLKLELIRGAGTGRNSEFYVVSVKAGGALEAALVKMGFDKVRSTTKVTRFTNAELRRLAEASVTSRAAYAALERELLAMLRSHVVRAELEVRGVVEALAELDVTTALADAADTMHLARPVVDDSGTLVVEDGRHLTVEASLGESGFVRNSLAMRNAPTDPQSLWILCAANASGKSTFLRQNALVVVMAQMGSFVPASKAHVGVVDRLFARVGSGDDISNNRSTFMMEMEEAAVLLSQATNKSLVIVDELGRGTSPKEGLAIAWASLEQLRMIGCRCLFATHFHELARDATSPGLAPAELHPTQVRNMTTRVETSPKDGKLVFTFQVIPGTSASSYALHVAELAGVPKRVLLMAEMMLVNGKFFDVRDFDLGEQ